MRKFTMACLIAAVMLAGNVFGGWPVDEGLYGVLGQWKMDYVQIPAPAAQYKLNDNAASTTIVNATGGTNAVWQHGNTSTGTTGAYCTGFVNAMDFDGANDYINTQQTFASTITDGDFAISFWIQPHDGMADTQYLFGQYDRTTGATLYATIKSDGRIEVVFNPCDMTSTFRSAQPVFVDGVNNWHFIVINFPMVMEPEPASPLPWGIQVFMDGVEVVADSVYDGDTTGNMFNYYSTTKNIYIGTFNGTTVPACGSFDGRIDNFAIYGELLDRGQIEWMSWIDDEDTDSAITTVYGSDRDGKSLTSSVSLDNLKDEGQVGGAFTFDGTNDYLYRADDDTYDFGTTSDFSISVWIKRGPTDAIQRIIEKKAAGAGWLLSTDYTNGRLYFLRTDGSTSTYTYSTGVDVQDGEWHHVVAVRTAGSTGKIYIDGVDRTDSSGNSSESYNLSNSVEMHVGCSGLHAYKFAGSMDELTIFNHAISLEDAKTMFVRGVAGTSPYGMDMDVTYYEQLRYRIWSLMWKKGDANGFVPPALSAYQTGGSFASMEFAVGTLYVMDDGVLYVNKTAKTTSPLAANCDPSTDTTNWCTAASPVLYRNFDPSQDLHVYTGTQWVHGYDVLPTSMDAYAYGNWSSVNGGIAPGTAQSITLNDTVVWNYITKSQEAIEFWCAKDTLNTPSDSFKAWWLLYEGTTYNATTDGEYQSYDVEFWGCNGSAYEWYLSQLGTKAYTWKLVVRDQSNDSDIAFHPTWYDAVNQEWVTWNESTNGYIQAYWKRIPRFCDLDYNYQSTSAPKVWFGDASQEPSGLKDKTYRDRYIRCTYATRNEASPTAFGNSKTLAQVLSDYASQYGYWNGTAWVDGSVTYNGQQMRMEMETCLGGTGGNGGTNIFLDSSGRATARLPIIAGSVGQMTTNAIHGAIDLDDLSDETSDEFATLINDVNSEWNVAIVVSPGAIKAIGNGSPWYSGTFYFHTHHEVVTDMGTYYDVGFVRDEVYSVTGFGPTQPPTPYGMFAGKFCECEHQIVQKNELPPVRLTTNFEMVLRNGCVTSIDPVTGDSNAVWKDLSDEFNENAWKARVVNPNQGTWANTALSSPFNELIVGTHFDFWSTGGDRTAKSYTNGVPIEASALSGHLDYDDSGSQLFLAKKIRYPVIDRRGRCYPYEDYWISPAMGSIIVDGKAVNNLDVLCLSFFWYNWLTEGMEGTDPDFSYEFFPQTVIAPKKVYAAVGASVSTQEDYLYETSFIFGTAVEIASDLPDSSKTDEGRKTETVTGPIRSIPLIPVYSYPDIWK